MPTLPGLSRTRDDREAAGPAPEHDWRVFAPTLDDSGRAYGELVRAVTVPHAALHALDTIARRAATNESLDGLRTRAAALVLHDLIALGWSVRIAKHYIEIRPPLGDDTDAKQAVRRQLEFGRDDQLREPATRRFIIGLERPGRSSALKPVTDLIADGRRLAAQLGPISALPRVERAVALAAICRPYLQLVDAEITDEFTGQRLMDIWRYFRHAWATRYRSSPGRNMFYLIRDAGQPGHPVMAITALGNAVMQLTRRDQLLGWTPDGLVGLVAHGVITDREAIEAFQRRLTEDFEQIFTDDLPVPRSLRERTSSTGCGLSKGNRPNYEPSFCATAMTTTRPHLRLKTRRLPISRHSPARPSSGRSARELFGRS